MPDVIIRKAFRVYGLLVDPEEIVLADPTGEFGVRTVQTGQIIVQPGTPMTRLEQGIYQYVFESPEPQTSYEYCVRIIWNTHTFYYTGIKNAAAQYGPETLYNAIAKLMASVRNCPDETARAAMRETARNFCRDTGAFVEDIVVTPATETDRSFQLISAWDADIQQILELKRPDTRRSLDIPVRPMRHDNTIEFEYPPKTAFVVSVSLLPRSQTALYPDWFVNRYGDIVADGAIAHLKSMSDQPWSDHRGADYFWQRWAYGIGDVRSQIITGNLNAPLRIRPRKIL